VPDPCIMYEGLKSDCTSNPLPLAHLDELKSKLNHFYQQNYAYHFQVTNLQPSQSLSSTSSQSSVAGRPPRKVNFTSWYQIGHIQPFTAIFMAIHTVKVSSHHLWLQLWHDCNHRHTVYLWLYAIMVRHAPLELVIGFSSSHIVR
jgi:hypothetical protein